TTTGPCIIGGNIIWIGGGTKNTNTYKNRMNPSVEDISVLLFDMNDNLLNFNHSDIDGNFEFNNLQYGTYKLIVELSGYITYPAIITVDANNEIVDDIVFDIDNGTVYYDVEEISAIGDGAKLYPNPAHNDLNIEFMLNKLSDVKISVLNALGQEIISVNQELSSGQQKINLDVSKLESGIYFINIEANGLDKKVLKFVK
ncbi:MAG: T9SS type A sorting domain-containing protein, partial [Bacteroidota bacterium]|nr:T9SS type A sorting domain-containing protein [Bacteroidota bacterium]